MASLATERVGSGPPLVLLHGGWLYGDLAWANQRSLAERWTLVIPDRVGYGGSAHLSDGEDFDRDAEILAPALDEGSHLVGWSSGAMAAMLTAARRPEAVASLTVIEPPAFHLAPSEAAREMHEGSARLFSRPLDDPVVFLKEFFALIGLPAPPDAMLEELSEPARVWHGFVRQPWVGDFGLEELAASPFPKLVISGGHSQAFEDVSDVIAEALGAEREVIRGAGHGPQHTGAPFNERLESFLRTAMSGAR